MDSETSPASLRIDGERIRGLVLLLLAFGFAYLVFLVCRPFFVPIIWSLILVTTTWPIYRRILARLGGRNTLASSFMIGSAFLLLFGIIGPLFTILAREAADWRQSEPSSLIELVAKAPNPKDLPVIGPVIRAAGVEGEVSPEKIRGYLALYRAQLAQVAGRFASQVLEAFANFFLCLLFSFFLYRDGAYVASSGRRALVRIGGPRFRSILSTCTVTVRAAVYGLLATAVAQGFLAGLGFLVAGAQFPILLGFVTLAASFAPFGAPLVYVPVCLHLLHQGHVLAGFGLLAWGVGVVSTSDNVLRTILISQSTQMSFLLVFMGIIGGILSFGLLGLFIGPVVMAVLQGLWLEWTENPRREAAAPAGAVAAEPLPG